MRDLPRFDRSFLGARERFTRIGSGPAGGKTNGLLTVSEGLARATGGRIGPIDVAIPTLTVLTADLFDDFLERNRLWDVALSGEADDVITHAFLRGSSLSPELVGDLRALATQVHVPLAVRSSSILEDARERPFAGVYATKMIPNDRPDADVRFARLVEAVKLVWASTFWKSAVSYRAATRAGERDERMAVIVQEVVGRRHGERLYPDVSGVARSFSFFRWGDARPEEGVVQLALGLGKTIVEGEATWTYSPARPHAGPPFSLDQLLKETQKSFWAVNMGTPSAYDPVKETEYLVRARLEDAELDGALRLTASTLDVRSDRVVPGAEVPGPRILNFAPLLVLEELPLNEVVEAALAACGEALGGPVEIEFAVTLDPRGEPPGRFCLVQARPMLVSSETVDATAPPGPGWKPLVASERVLGNGVLDSIRDVVAVRPDRFDLGSSRAIAEEVAALNRALVEAKRPYLLVGFGRWGSADPWLGVPVAWGDVAGAAAIVEAALGSRPIEMSQGAHFFHNISSFRVFYFSMPADGHASLDWDWLVRQPAESETTHLRHVRLEKPLLVAVDGRTGRGAVWRHEP